MDPLQVRGPSDSISSTMLNRLKNREADAWCQFVEIWAMVIYGWCRQHGVAAVDAQDIVQNVLLQVFQGLPDFERKKTFRGWLWTITSRKIIDHFRHRARSPNPPGGSHGVAWIHDIADPYSVELEEPAVADTDCYLVHKTLELIRHDFQENTFRAFWLTAVEQLSAGEAAERLGMTTVGVRRCKYRVLQRLGEELKGMLKSRPECGLGQTSHLNP